MTSPGSLTAVVVDWNLPDHTIRCARSLVADGVPSERIVVVENGPTDASWSRVSNELSGCVLVRTDANLGFGKASNIGARTLPGEAYLLVNNDAFVHKAGSVSALLSALDQARIGIVVPRILNDDLSLQPTVVPFTTPIPALVRASGLSRFLPDRWQPHLSTHWSHTWSCEVQAAVGAVMLVDGQVWERLAGLREDSFMYAEDIDLCWRAQGEGFATWFCGESEFVHIGGASSDRRWSIRERWERTARAEGAIIREHLSPGKAAAALAFTRLGVAARVVYFNLAGNADAAARCSGYLAGMRSARLGDVEDERISSPGVEVVRPPALDSRQ